MTRRGGLAAPHAVLGESNSLEGITVERLPHDPEAELAVLAEVAEPLHPTVALAVIDGSWFYDRRNGRCVDAVLSGDTTTLTGLDVTYIKNAIAYAYPLTASLLDTFIVDHFKRVRLLELEAERCELLGVSV